MNKTHTISLLGSDNHWPCSETVPVLVAMYTLGLNKIQVGCRSGGCGICRVRVVEGPYHVGKMSRAHVTEEEEAAGIALACRIFPEGDLVLEPLGKKMSS